MRRNVQVGFLIGPGGRNIRAITLESGADVIQVGLRSPLLSHFAR